MKKLLALGTVVLGILTAGAKPAAAQTVLPRSGWVATASTTNSGEPASRAIDGSSSTRWSTGTNQTAGQWFSIDMITPQTLSQLTIDPTGSTNDWTRGYQVFVSNDAIDWGAPVASGSGAAGVLTIVFPTQTARFVGIVQTSSGSNWWSIGEINVYGPGATPTVLLSPTGWGATASVTGGSDVASKAIDGNLSTRWSTGTSQVNGQSFQLDMLQQRTVAKIVMDSGGSSSDYARGYQIFISNSTSTWGTAVASGSATSSPIAVTFPQTTGRYLKIVQTSSASSFWSIAELSVYGVGIYAPTAQVLPRIGWIASSSVSCSSDLPSRAIDDNLSTRYSTCQNQTSGQSFQVDMLTARSFTKLTLDAGSSNSDYPRGYAVYVSQDGTNWGSAIATGNGTGPLVTINFAYQNARFIKVVLTSSISNWWSIAEFNVYGLPPYLLLREGWVATASLNSSTAISGIDGKLSTKWTTNTNQANGQWFQVDMLAPQTFNEITLDADGSTSDFPRGYQVFVSNNPSVWGGPVATGVGSASIVSVGFPPQTARYIRVVQTGSASNWWSIAELNVYGNPFFYGVPRVDAAAPLCSDGSRPVGCQAFDCTTGADTGQWLAAPACTGAYPICTQACPSAGTPLSALAPSRSGQTVECACSCGDPVGGATNMTVTVTACTAAQNGASCDSLCRGAGDLCGSAAGCSLTRCTSGTLSRVVSTQSCDPTTPTSVNISGVADWGATLALGSQMTISVGGATTQVPLTGDLSFNMGSDFFDLTSLNVASPQFSFFGHGVTAPQLMLTAASRPATLTTGGDPEFSPTTFSFEPGRLAATVQGVVDGQLMTMPVTNTDQVDGQLSVDGQTITLQFHGTPSIGTAVDLTLLARVTYQPPFATLAASSVVECSSKRTAVVSLDASGSTTFDESPVARYQWFIGREADASDLTPLGSGATIAARLPVGTNVVGVNVYDRNNSTARTTRTILVRDTIAPAVTSPGDVIVYAGGASSMDVNIGYPAISDQCDSSPSAVATIVSINGASSNVPVPDPSHVNLPVGEYAIGWSIIDIGQNLVSILQSISVRPGVGQTQSALTGVPSPCPVPPLTGTTPVSVDLHVCVFGRMNLTTQSREGTPAWASCSNDACVMNNISTLMAEAATTWADTVTFNVVGFKVIRDNVLPHQNTLQACTNSGHQNDKYGDLCFDEDLHLPTEARQAVMDCEAAWGYQPMSGLDDNCSRGLVLVLGVARANGGGVKCGFGDTGSVHANDFSGDPAHPTPACLDAHNAGPNDIGAYALVVTQDSLCNNVPRSISHELGHSMGLHHGDGIDEDCDGVFDDLCDIDEFPGLDTGPLSLMSDADGVPPTVTNLQKNRARIFATKTLPNTPNRACPAPPLPPAPVDVGAPPQPAPQQGGCGCETSPLPGPASSLVLVAALALVAGRSRRREVRPARRIDSDTGE